jgi:peptide/nickel transport system substrate-binding protein
MLLAASNSMRNIPTDRVWADEYRTIGNGHPAQFFIKQ